MAATESTPPSEHIRLTQEAAEASAHGRLDEAEKKLRELLAWREHSHLPPDSLSFSNLAGCLLAQGRAEEAHLLGARALEAARFSGNPSEHGIALWTCGQARQALGQLEPARRDLEEAVALLEPVGPPLAAVQALIALGGVQYLAGEWRIAEHLWKKAIPVLRLLDLPLHLAGLLTNLGGLLHKLGQYSEAATVLDEAASRLPAEEKMSALAMQLRGNRGLALCVIGRLDEAEADLEEAASCALNCGAFATAAQRHLDLSQVCQWRGDYEGAIRHQRELMQLQREHGVMVQTPPAQCERPVPSQIEGVACQQQLVAPGPDPAFISHFNSTSKTMVPSNIGASSHSRCQDTGRPVVLLAPPMEDLHGPLFPRGATSVASFLNAHGVSALVVPLSHYLDSTMPGAGSLDRSRQQAIIRDVLVSLRPRAIGITIPFTHLYPTGLDLARMVRRSDEKVPIVVGGPHVTYQDQECLHDAPEIDVVVRGEGEWTLLNLLEAWSQRRDLSSVAGITWRTPQGEIRRNPRRPLGDLLELPELDFSLLPHDFCRHMQLSGITGRGCLFRCTFCHEFRFWGGVARQYPVETVVRELERLATLYDNRMYGIDDSMLDLRSPYFFDLCHQLARSPHMPDSFGLLTRVDTLSAEGLQAMRQAGIERLALGIESGSDRILAAMNKGFDSAILRTGLEMTHQAGVRVSAFLMVGHPGDSVEESQMTHDFVNRLFVDELITWIDPAMFVPYPGTPIFAHPDRYGVEILCKDYRQWHRCTRPIAQLIDFPANEIQLAYLQLLAMQARYLNARKSYEVTGER
jgi:anaerobic magnesium-protoporphyrin IX monomethyl ester cyclase